MLGVIIYHFRRFAQPFTLFAQANPTRNKSVKIVASKSCEPFCAMTRSRTTPYHSEGNEQCEKFNQTLFAMLKTLLDTKKAQWYEYVIKVDHAYNCTRNDETGYFPFYLLFGRTPHSQWTKYLRLTRNLSPTGHNDCVRWESISVKPLLGQNEFHKN